MWSKHVFLRSLLVISAFSYPETEGKAFHRNNMEQHSDTRGYHRIRRHTIALYFSCSCIISVDFVTSVRHLCSNDLSEANVKPTFLFYQSSLSLHLVDPLDFQGEPCQFHHQQMYIEDTSTKNDARLNQNQPHSIIC